MITGGTLMAITGLSIMLFRDLRTMEEHPSWKNVGFHEIKKVEVNSQQI